MQWLDFFADFIARLTPVEGILLILVIVFHRATIKSYKMRVKDRQQEIDRLAKENHDYRDRFTRILTIETEKKYGSKTKPASTQSRGTKK